MVGILKWLLAPLVTLVVEEVHDAIERRVQRRRAERIAEARKKELEDARQDQLRHDARKRIQQRRGPGSTPVPIPGVSDAETPEPPPERGADYDPWADD